MQAKLKHASVELARALEATETAVAVESVRTLQGRLPASGAVTFEAAGGVAIFTGAGSPLSQALNLGMKGPVKAGEIGMIEDFYRGRNTSVVISLCPLADPSLLDALASHGYRITHFEHTMCRWLDAQDPAVPQLAGGSVRPAGSIRTVAPEEAHECARLTMLGFGEGREPQAPMVQMFAELAHAQGASSCWLWSEESAQASASMSVCGNVALLFGDATLLAFRGRGCQQALIAHRLAEAARQGCYLAMACTLPGSVSQRNYERAGFQVVYTKAMLLREWKPGEPDQWVM